jgi:hypothetical protein
VAVVGPCHRLGEGGGVGRHLQVALFVAADADDVTLVQLVGPQEQGGLLQHVHPPLLAPVGPGLDHKLPGAIVQIPHS